MPVNTILKPCSVCKISKPLEAFHRSSSLLSGRRSDCKECAIKIKEERRIPTSAKLELSESDIKRFWSRVDKTLGHGPNGDCWVWTGRLEKTGYGRMTLKGSRNLTLGRIAYFLGYGKDIYPLWGLHRCDYPPCVRPDHIFPGNHIDNMRDCMEKGRRPTGERLNLMKSPHVKLTPEKVRQGRAMRASGATFREIGEALHVSGRQASYIQTDHWKWVD